MADDKDARSYRTGNPFARGGTTDQSGAAGQGGDPLAELARLIGQHDPFAELGRGAAPRDARTSPSPPGAPPAEWRAARGGRGQEGYRDYPVQPSEDTVPEGRNAPAYPSYTPDYRATDRGSEAPASDERYVESPRFDTPRYRDPHYGEESDGSQDEVHRRYGEDEAYDERQGYEGRAGHYEQPYDQDGADERAYAAGDYYDDADAQTDDDGMYDEPRRSRGRGGLITVAAVLGLAVIGTAGAFGYRSYINSAGSQPPVIKADTTPSKVIPTTQSTDSGSSKMPDRLGDRGQGERVVSREEQPVQMNDAPRPVTPRVITGAPGGPGGVNASVAIPPNASALASAPGVASEPRKIRTVTIRPDQQPGADPGARADQSAAMRPARAPAARSAPPPPANAQSGTADVTPSPPSPPARTASAATGSTGTARTSAGRAPAIAAGDQTGFFVQLSAQKSEDEAQASFRSMQAKFPSLLGSRQPVIRRKELGEKGTYFGAQVGPFAAREDANQLCESLKSQGGSCIVQKN